MLAILAVLFAPVVALGWRHPVSAEVWRQQGWAQKLTIALERDSAFRLETVPSDTPLRPLCGATPFGVDRSLLDDFRGRTRVYAWVFCVWYDPNNLGELADGPMVITPIAATFGGHFAYETPMDGEEYPESVEELIPARYMAAIRTPPGEYQDMVTELKRRYASLRH